MSEEAPDFETAFIIIGTADGQYFATTELSEEFTINRAADRTDIKRACRELYDKLVVEEIAATTAHLLDRPAPDEAARRSVKEALSKRNLL